ncbi:H-NS histone family protein [Cypionkella psychrotolerans]|uniref:H-NS histone family protein n=1 Tax=Cypionkella psychrotolerans TaxID=1678131 RepID=UPI000AB56377
MADFDVAALSSKELRKLLKDLAKAISTQQDRRKDKACAKIDAITKEMGYSLADLIGTEVKPARAPDATKYRHPENKGPTWPAVDASRRGSEPALRLARRQRALQSHHACRPFAQTC